MNVTHPSNSPSRLRGLGGICLLVLLSACFSQAALGQRRRAPRTAPAKPPAESAPVLAPKDPPQAFDQLAAEANAAREGDRLEEAVDKYRRALALRPQWAEGWWYLATIHYDRDNYAEAARGFKEAARLQPKAGAAWAMLGICE